MSRPFNIANQHFYVQGSYLRSAIELLFKNVKKNLFLSMLTALGWIVLSHMQLYTAPRTVG